MIQPLKLLLEKPEYSELEVLVEEEGPRKERTVYITGPYLMASKPNKNNRIYDLSEMVGEVNRYKNELITKNRALGELNHPKESVEIDLNNACHMIVSLEQKDNYFIGKSKILSTPSGVVVKQLLNDGVKLGVSSRSLGRLIPEGAYNAVRNLRILACDLVHEPSVDSAMLDSIMENRQFIIAEGGKIVELACDSLACKLNALPKKDIDNYLKEAFTSFINELKRK